MKGFTKCANGHYYKEELSSCPYCHDGNELGRDAVIYFYN
jgi:DNA-binding helix-hairpin-helix protein with protein kinase domain